MGREMNILVQIKMIILVLIPQGRLMIPSQPITYPEREKEKLDLHMRKHQTTNGHTVQKIKKINALDHSCTHYFLGIIYMSASYHENVNACDQNKSFFSTLRGYGLTKNRQESLHFSNHFFLVNSN